MSRLPYFAVTAFACLVLIGCDSGKTESPSSAQKMQGGPSQGDSTGFKHPPVQQNEPGTAKLSKDTVTDASADQLKSLQKDQNAAKAAYDKAPSDKSAKDKYVASTVKLATATMLTNSLDQKVKYKEALKLYREALKVDPSNNEAQTNKDLIEGIYKQMGRPIPE